MEILKYEKIEAEFNPWTEAYLSVANSLIELIRTDELDVIHIGSTSAMVGGKGIIDLSVLYEGNKIDSAIARLKSLGFQDQVSSKPFPPERPRKDGAVFYNGKKYFIHVHIIESGSDEHMKQLQYKEHLLSSASVRKEYEESKKVILAGGVTEQEAYGKLKSPFVKSVLKHM